MISPLFQDEILCQSLTLGFYLLFMGLGTFHGSKKKLGRWCHFFNIEFLLTSYSSVLAILIYSIAFIEQVFFSRFITQNSAVSALMPFQIASITLGYLTGLEIPLLKKFCEEKNIQISLNFLLSGSYFGAITSSFITYFFLFPHYNFDQSLLLVGLVNWACALLTASITPLPLNRFAFRCGVLLLLLFAAMRLQPLTKKVEQLFLKSYYSEIKNSEWTRNAIFNTFSFLNDLRPIQRIQTSYQAIDLIPEHIGYPEVLKNEFALYLDLQPQFSESSTELYHQTMSHGAINLSGKIPQNVLILGGGDGLLARELLRYEEVQKISLVELDPQMINLAQNDYRFLRLNENSLQNPKIHIKMTDAYQFIKTTNEKYDAIFIDFPFPFSYEISRLYSVEFYKNILSILSPGGFAVIDCPINRDFAQIEETPQAIIAKTVQTAGFENTLLFGPLDPFLFIENHQPKIQFRYEVLPSFVSNKTLVNLTPLNHLLPEKISSINHINSIFKPRRFR